MGGFLENPEGRGGVGYFLEPHNNDKKQLFQKDFHLKIII